jgi:DNA-binding NtrC family response regulator
MNGKSKVAIIDDEADMRESVSQWLQLSGFEPLCFEAAEPALKVLSPDFAGVVISDIRMPGMDGMALLRRLQSIDPGLPVILMTGHGDVPMAVEAMRIGAFDFVEKPFEPDRLAELCQRGSIGAVAERRHDGWPPVLRAEGLGCRRSAAASREPLRQRPRQSAPWPRCDPPDAPGPVRWRNFLAAARLDLHSV